MNLLFTGASGFLGNNIYPLLKDNYSIATIGLALQDNYSTNLAIEIPNLTKGSISYSMLPVKPTLPLKQKKKNNFFLM